MLMFHFDWNLGSTFTFTLEYLNSQKGINFEIYFQIVILSSKFRIFANLFISYEFPQIFLQNFYSIREMGNLQSQFVHYTMKKVSSIESLFINDISGSLNSFIRNK